MDIKLGLINSKFTNVPSEDQCNGEKRFYVYEWFVKDTGEVFYIVKGTGQRYLQDKNYEFMKVNNAYDVDVRIVKNQLSEHEALELEENLMIQRTNEGYVLANVQVPVIGGGVYYQEGHHIMEAPVVVSSKVDKHYFGVKNLTFDPVSENKLLKSSLKKSVVSEMWNIYLRHSESLDIQEKKTTNKK